MPNRIPVPQHVPMAIEVRTKREAHLQTLKASLAAETIAKFRGLVIQQIDAAIQRMDSSEPDHLDEAVDGNTGNTRIIIDTTKWVSHTDGFRDAIQKANLSTLWPYSKAIQEVMNIVLEQIGKEGGWNVHAESGTTNDVNKDSIPDKIILEEPIPVVKRQGWFKRMMSAIS